jgi:hypothetical protein
MKKHIAEDLPARKFPQASLSKGGQERRDSGGDSKDGEKSPEQRVRQAVYDIRYRARRENIPLRSAYSQYMQNSSLNEQEKTQVREKLFGKEGIVKETYLNDVSGLATKSVAKALYNVFVEPKSEQIDYDQLKDDLEEASHLNKYNSNSKKYKVRVTDKNGTSYVRYATREKINALRANPNIESVEMTEYGEPYEGERSKGEQTAAATSGKDWDGDGNKESSAKEYRGVVHNAIQKRRGGTPDGKDTSSVKEEFIGEVKKNNKPKKTYDVMRGTNKSRIKVAPQDGVHENAYSEFLNILSEKTLTTAEKRKKEEIVKKLKPKYGKTSKTYAIATSVAKRVAEGTECGCDDEKETKIKNGEKDVDDSRSIPTKISLFKNKLRAMGLNMDYEPEGEVIDERRREEKGTPRKPRDRAVEFVKSQNKEGMMTRSGKTIAQHESERGVPESDRPKKAEQTTADRLAARKQRQAAAAAAAERREREEDRRRRLG